MYCVVVQSSINFSVTRVVKCFNLATVQEVLERFSPEMDFSYLMNGDVLSVTDDESGKIYSFFKHEHSDYILNEYKQATDS